MANTIKIPVQFLGDSTQAAKSIKELEDQIKALEAEFKNAKLGTPEFKRLDEALKSSKKSLAAFQGDTSATKEQLIGLAASVYGIVASYREFIGAAIDAQNSQRKLVSASAMTGQSLDAMRNISSATKDEFKLSTQQANEYVISLSKLTAKAGQAGQTQKAIGAFLEIGAAQGLSATQTLEAVNQAILGIDEGTDKLFQKNPSVIYDEFGKKIGKTGASMTDAEKAQALLNEAMTQGGKIAGGYSKMLDTGSGALEQFKTKSDEAKAAIGSQLLAALKPVLQILTVVSDVMKNDFVSGAAAVALEVGAVAGVLKLVIPLVEGLVLRIAAVGGATAALTTAFNPYMLAITAAVAAWQIYNSVVEDGRKKDQDRVESLQNLQRQIRILTTEGYKLGQVYQDIAKQSEKYGLDFDKATQKLQQQQQERLSVDMVNMQKNLDDAEKKLAAREAERSKLEAEFKKQTGLSLPDASARVDAAAKARKVETNYFVSVEDYADQKKLRDEYEKTQQAALGLDEALNNVFGGNFKAYADGTNDLKKQVEAARIEMKSMKDASVDLGMQIEKQNLRGKNGLGVQLKDMQLQEREALQGFLKGRRVSQDNINQAMQYRGDRKALGTILNPLEADYVSASTSGAQRERSQKAFEWSLNAQEKQLELRKGAAELMTNEVLRQKELYKIEQDQLEIEIKRQQNQGTLSNKDAATMRKQLVLKQQKEQAEQEKVLSRELEDSKNAIIMDGIAKRYQLANIEHQRGLEDAHGNQAKVLIAEQKYQNDLTQIVRDAEKMRQETSLQRFNMQTDARTFDRLQALSPTDRSGVVGQRITMQGEVSKQRASIDVAQSNLMRDKTLLSPDEFASRKQAIDQMNESLRQTEVTLKKLGEYDWTAFGESAINLAGGIFQQMIDAGNSQVKAQRKQEQERLKLTRDRLREEQRLLVQDNRKKQALLQEQFDNGQITQAEYYSQKQAMDTAYTLSVAENQQAQQQNQLDMMQAQANSTYQATMLSIGTFAIEAAARAFKDYPFPISLAISGAAMLATLALKALLPAPSVKSYATGGIVTEPTLAVIGDGKKSGNAHDTEVVANMRQMAMLGRSLEGSKTQSVNQTIIIKNDVSMDNEKFGTAYRKDSRRKSKLQIGK